MPTAKSKSLTAHVTPEFSERFEAKARELSSTPGELARAVLERFLASEPFELQLLAEVTAVRALLARGLLDPNRPTTELGVKTLIYETDRDKFDKARQLREQGGSR